MEVAAARRRLAAGPEMVDELLPARAARVEREIDEHLEGALRAPSRGRQWRTADEQRRRAEERQAQRLAAGLARTLCPAVEPRQDVAQRRPDRGLERPARVG